MALEIVFISIICFDGIKKIIYPLNDLCNFSIPSIPLGKGELFSSCLETLTNEIIIERKKQAHHNIHDYEPLCIIFTDRTRVDQVDNEIYRWKREFSSCHTVIYTLGDKPDLESFVKVTPEVIRLEYTTYYASKILQQIVGARVEASIKCND